MFTECQDGVWTPPVALTKEGGDLFGTALAVDGQGRLWAFWSANEKDNWDLYGAARDDRGWSEAIRISDAPGSDFHHVAATDAEGRVWRAWQSLGATQSDILVARQEGTSFGAPTVIAGGPSNEWEPAISAAPGGHIPVAWDTYERGNYDVVLKTWQAGTWSEARVIAATLRNEARPSLAYDRENRLWITYGGLSLDEITFRGVKIGAVTSQDFDPKMYQAVVTHNIRKDVELPVDSSAIITSDGLLGNYYVKLEPGAEDALLKEGDEIAHAQGALDLVELINKFVVGGSSSSSQEESATP